MQVGDCLEETEHDLAGSFFRVRVVRVQISTAAQFQHNKDAILIIEGFDCPNNIRMIEASQNRDCDPMAAQSEKVSELVVLCAWAGLPTDKSQPAADG